MYTVYVQNNTTSKLYLLNVFKLKFIQPFIWDLEYYLSCKLTSVQTESLGKFSLNFHS